MAAPIVNVRRDVEDKFYRYKMPLLLTKIEGKGNGIKTVFPNMADVARALNRPSSYPTKFFGNELGAQATFNDSTERYIVNGAHDATRMRELMDQFIDKFVLCGSCKNPETELLITKDENILRDCKACGQQSKVPPTHKLVTFILKNPPKKASKNSRRAATAGADSMGAGNGQTPNGGDVGDEEDGGTDDELTKKIEAGAANILTEEQAAALIKARENDDDWAEDTSKEAVAARAQALGGQMQQSLLLDDDDDDAVGGPYDVLGDWVKELKGKGEAPTDAEIYRKAEELGIAKKHKTVLVLVQAMFDEGIATQIEEHAGLYQKLVTSEKHQKSLLGGIERFVGVTHPDLVKTDLPKILMAFYQADVLEEELLKNWGTHVSKKYVDRDTSKRVRKAADPFLKWLDEAEESDSEED